MADLATVLSRDYCELFLFFNYDGVNRIAGLAATKGGSETLEHLFGTPERVAALLASLDAAQDSGEREEIIVTHFKAALEADAGAKFVIPFRFEREDKARTSHYLIHATKHPLGFKIMKSIMSRAAKSRGERGALQMLQSSNQLGGRLFATPQWNELASEVLELIRTGPVRVEKICERVLSPGDMYSEEDYREVLLELEATGRIEVIDLEKSIVIGPEKRVRKGKVTMGDTRFVRTKSP